MPRNDMPQVIPRRAEPDVGIRNALRRGETDCHTSDVGHLLRNDRERDHVS